MIVLIIFIIALLVSIMWVDGISNEPPDYDGSDLFGEE